MNETAGIRHARVVDSSTPYFFLAMSFMLEFFKYSSLLVVIQFSAGDHAGMQSRNRLFVSVTLKQFLTRLLLRISTIQNLDCHQSRFAELSPSGHVLPNSPLRL